MSDLSEEFESYIISKANHNPNAFAQLKAEIPLYRKVLGSLLIDIAEHVDSILKSKGKNRHYLAELLGKTDSEISKWLSGTHNLTLESVAKMSAALEVDFLISPHFLEGYFGQVNNQSILAPAVANKNLDYLLEKIDYKNNQHISNESYGYSFIEKEHAGEYAYAMGA